MIDDTINDKNTIAGDGQDMIHAGRYNILRQFGEGGIGAVWLSETDSVEIGVNHAARLYWKCITLKKEQMK